MMKTYIIGLLKWSPYDKGLGDKPTTHQMKIKAPNIIMAIGKALDKSDCEIDEIRFIARQPQRKNVLMEVNNGR